MIPVHHGNIVRLWDESTPIAHIVGRGQRLLWRRRTGVPAKRNGVKEPLLEIPHDAKKYCAGIFGSRMTDFN